MMLAARIPPPTSTADLERYSEANPGWKIEREADGTIVMSPTNGETGRRNMRLAALLTTWNDGAAAGECFDSSTGFRMPDGSILSPDASWIEGRRWHALSPAEREDYAPLVPDVCIELVSKSDSLGEATAKARRYRAYGARYVIVIDPQTKTLWSDGEPPSGFPTDLSRVMD